MICQKNASHHGWGVKKIFDSGISKTAISVIINPKEERRAENRNFKQKNISDHKLYNI